MSPSEESLRARLAARLGGRGAGGLAVVRGAPPELRAAWVPASFEREPQLLVYSVTKTFIGALALLLQEEGRFSLDDILVRWHPEIPGSSRISIRALLRHTAGVPDYGALPTYHDAVRTSPGKPWSFEEFGHQTWAKGLRFEPGAGWAYSNPGYLLVKRVLEAVSGARFAELVRTRICGRLGLSRTFAPGSVAELASLAPSTSTLLSPAHEARDVRSTYHPGWVSHGVLASTASEVARFLHALFAGGLLGAASLRELTSLAPVPGGPPRWRTPSYGLGVMADPDSRFGPVFGHGGGGPGFEASAFHAARLGATVCALAAVEESFLAEGLVFETLDSLRRA